MMMDPRRTHSPTRGILPALRDLLFGEHDAVTVRLRDYERRESWRAPRSHVAAFSLIVLLSLASLIAFSADALRQVQSQWVQGRIDLPAVISVSVSLLIVVAMDTAILRAARSIRRLADSRASMRERAAHVAVLVLVCILEAATYIYRAWAFDRPETWEAWGIIIVRGLIAPLLGVYLSLDRPIPIGPRDVLYQVELRTGARLIGDVVVLVNDPHVPLEHIAQLYYIAAPMPREERERMDGVLAVLHNVRSADGLSHLALPDMANHTSRSRDRREVPHKRPVSRMPHQPSAGRGRRASDGSPSDASLADGAAVNDWLRSNVRTPSNLTGDETLPARIDAQPRADTGMS